MNTSCCEIASTDGSNYFDDFNNTALDIYFREYPIYAISVLLGFPTNFYVIWLIVRGTGNGLAAEFFSLNISISEIILCLHSLTCLLEYTFEIPSIMWPILIGLIITGRPLFQCLMCVEHYLAVVHPVTFLKYKPLRYRVICSVIAWVASFGASVLYYIIWWFILMEYYLYYMLAQQILYLSIQLFCLVAVLRALKQSGPGERVREREEENHMKRRAFYVILITTVTTVVIARF
ncbi:C-C chemokine receptor type 5-like [Onychostoma macrolepis]|uniref:C-C chemokine receptor type 5-like n=1 Tax=Onychostoma macrolepis TaxID=369639 RepID=UPI00272B8915|nr:C-C chemokine receptor type 5-like [Onychostoma macrolepis]